MLKIRKLTDEELLKLQSKCKSCLQYRISLRSILRIAKNTKRNLWANGLATLSKKFLKKYGIYNIGKWLIKCLSDPKKIGRE